MVKYQIQLLYHFPVSTTINNDNKRTKNSISCFHSDTNRWTTAPYKSSLGINTLIMFLCSAAEIIRVRILSFTKSVASDKETRYGPLCLADVGIRLKVLQGFIANQGWKHPLSDGPRRSIEDLHVHVPCLSMRGRYIKVFT